MPVVNLATYVMLDKSKGHSTNNPPELRDVFMPDDKHVGVGLTTFFGFKSTVEDLSKIRMAHHSNPDIEIYSVELSTQIKKTMPVTMKVKDLKSCEVLHLGHLSSELNDIVLNYFVQFLTGPNMSKEKAQAKCADVKTALTFRPELLADLHDQVEFNHMDMFIYEIGSGTERSTRATLFDYKNLVKAEYKNAPEGMPLYLPFINGVDGHEVINRIRKKSA